jgi:hypothetical protein
MAKKNKDKMREMENVKYEVAQEMGLPQTKKTKKRKQTDSAN